MKWLLIGLIVALTTYSGYSLANKYPKRLRLYTELCRFCQYYMAQISFKNAKVREIVAAFDASCELAMVFNTYFESGAAVCRYLSAAELADVNSFLSELGRGDVVVEQARTASALVLFEGVREQCAESKRRYYSMYTKLGLLLGLLIAILLV